VKRGFTLIEVLVALAIVAISVMAGLRAAGSMTRNADRQWQVLLAQICADNSLYRLRLTSGLPDVGESSAECLQAGLNLEVVLNVHTTPNPAFRRVDAQVFLQSTPLLRVSTVVGRY
jgi:general secretion pathway protein I